MFKFILQSKRCKKMKYTFDHKKAYLLTEKKILGKNTLSGYLHDIDKLVLYPLIGCKLTKIIHRKVSRHHSEFVIKDSRDYVGMFIDWECARLTKKDKQLTGMETLNQYYPELKVEVENALAELSNKFID